jgi:hypothetical protein
MSRYIDLKRAEEILRQIRNLEKEYDEMIKEGMHCKNCGDTRPKHGFYPLQGMAIGDDVFQTSWYLCNKCALSDKDYEERFREPKSNDM